MSRPSDLALNKGRAVAALSAPTRRLHRLVLTMFVATGQAPPRARTDAMARENGIDPRPAWAELVEGDVIALDEDGEIRAAYPFSPTPTRHVVTWEGGPTTFAMCAVDALGMSAMLDRPVTITSTEPGTDTPVTVEVHRDRARWIPDTTVVLAGAVDGTCSPSVDRTCGHIDFFTSAHTAQAWASSHPGISAVVLDQVEALACGIREFGSLLHGPAAEG